ncbi:MAG TPA: hypothetical protein VK900_07905 [Anaerolineales bacterium]|nr:hypothetical protein [Anaerolineales bacterium]
MQASSTRLTKPLHIWLARIVGIGIVLVCIWLNLRSLPAAIRLITGDGVVLDIGWGIDASTQTAIIDFVNSEAAAMGVRVGDTLLNPWDANLSGEIGSPVTLLLQDPEGLVRSLTFLRKPYGGDALGASILGLSATTSTALALAILILPFLFASVCALFLCWLKSDDWMALLTAIAFARVIGAPGSHPAIIVFRMVTASLPYLWFILFPNGKFLPRRAWLILLLLLLPSPVFYGLWNLNVFAWSDGVASFEKSLIVLEVAASLAIVIIIAYRYSALFSPFERQQSKWVIVALLTGIIPLLILGVASSYYWYQDQFRANYIFGFLFSAGYAALTIIVIVGTMFAVFQYRLYDVDLLVSRAIVYSSLTGILGLVGLLITPLIHYILQQTFGNQTGLLAIMVSALPIAALFNPVRERLQRVVDHRFKEEEIDLENTFIEFTSELRNLFTIEELSTLLSHHAVEQLDVSYASVFVTDEHGNLKHIKTTSLDEEPFEPPLESMTVERIKNGQLASPDGDYARSLIVPLVVPRSRKPSFLGALVLGPRLKGLGYSTAIVKSLKKLGEEVGKAFYLAELKNNKNV